MIKKAERDDGEQHDPPSSKIPRSEKETRTGGKADEHIHDGVCDIQNC
jgi:hypothetical protein